MNKKLKESIKYVYCAKCEDLHKVNNVGGHLVYKCGEDVYKLQKKDTIICIEDKPVIKEL